MSDNDEFDDDANGEDSNLVRDLRKQLKEAKKRDAETSARLASFEAAQRKSSVADLLKKAGADPDYAEFYTGEDSSEDAVTAWIQSKSKLLGINQSDDDTDPDLAKQVDAVSHAAANAPQLKIGSMEDKVARINAAKTQEEFQAALKEAGFGTS